MSAKKMESRQQHHPLVHFQRQPRLHRRPFGRLPRWRNPLVGYILSVPFIGGTLIGTIWEQRILPDFYFSGGPLLVVVVLMTLIWGVGPAIFSAILGAVGLLYLYVPSFAKLDFADWRTDWHAALPILPFLVSGVVIAIITGLRESARQRAHLAEQKEQERASTLEATFEAMADGVVVYDHDGSILRTNAAARKLFALDVKPRPKFSLRLQRERRPALTILDEHGEILPQDQSPLARILSGEVLTSANAMDVVLRRPDGEEIQLNVTGAPVYTFGGDPISAICVFRDVTERRQLERRTHDTLNALLAMAETLVQGLEDSTKELPASRPTTVVVEEYGPAAANEVARRLARLTCSVLGCRRVGIVAIDPETELLRPVAVVGLSPEQERQWWADQRLVGRLIDTPFPECVARLRAKEVLVLDMTEAPLRDLPNPYHIRTMLVAPMFVGEHLVGTLLLDYAGEEHEYSLEETALAGAIAKLAALVIERERLLYEREQARANEIALREANRRMDEFLGIAGHELRTPLTTIKGNIQLARRQLKKGMNEDGTYADDLARKFKLIEDLLDRAERQVRLQNRLVGELLDVSRIQANKITLNKEPCELAAIVRAAVQEQCQAVPLRTINLEVATDKPIPIFADADRIYQVVTNFLTNALKYSAVDKPVDVYLTVENRIARVSVRDEGPGLSAEEQQYIWERFHQLERIKVQSGSSVGLGLGLHICRTIIENHQGQAGVESTPGEGSTFWFTLPLAERDEKSQSL